MDNKKKTQNNSRIEYKQLKPVLSDYYEKCSGHALDLFQDYRPEELSHWCKMKITEFKQQLSEERESLSKSNECSEESKAIIDIFVNNHKYSIN